jgi:DNA-binding response OmpR family regulator
LIFRPELNYGYAQVCFGEVFMGNKILVIDDSNIALQWIRLNLTPFGFEVTTYNTPIGTQDFINRTQPDLILLDVGMPTLSGDLLCKMIKDNPRTKNTIVALYSSLPEDELKEMAEKSGANGYIQKTDDIELLSKRINELLKRQSLGFGGVSSQPSKNYKITLIDDSPIALHWVRSNLAPFGYDVTTFQGPIGAENFVESQKPEAILLDVRMPFQTGDILCKLLKLNPKTSDIAVILYSELPEEELKRLSRECMADGYIVKSDRIEKLADKVQALLDKKKAEKSKSH